MAEIDKLITNSVNIYLFEYESPIKSKTVKLITVSIWFCWTMRLSLFSIEPVIDNLVVDGVNSRHQMDQAKCIKNKSKSVEVPPPDVVKVIRYSASHQDSNKLSVGRLPITGCSHRRYNAEWCLWCNGYRRRKWTRWHEFKSWTRLIAFHIALIPLGKVWILSFSLQLWVNSRAD